MADLLLPYDQVPYPSTPLSQVHPDRLAALGRLFGLQHIPVELCRVLELGCGDGSNLVALAAAFPESRFVGIDLAATAIAKARAYAAECELTNVEFRHANIADPAAVTETFDYVLCHGVYSWVVPEIREAILRCCRCALSPQGLALVSYNALPGWRVHQPTRDILLWHLRGLEDPAERQQEAVAFAKFLSEAISDTKPAGTALRAEFRELLEKDPRVLWHDELGAEHRAFYFHEFMQAAAAHGLAFVAENDLGEHLLKTLPAETLAAVNAVASDRIEREQYLDFLVPRRFRQTILTHAGRPALAQADPAELADCAFAAISPDLRSSGLLTEPGIGRFEFVEGPSLETDFLPGKLALQHLIASAPERIPFPRLFQHILGALGARTPVERDRPGLQVALLRFLFDIACGRFVSWHVARPRLTREPGLRPNAFPPARVQASRTEVVPTIHHQLVRLEERWARELVTLCDGSRTHSELLTALRARVLEADGEEDHSWKLIEADLGGALRRLATQALFTA